MLNFVGISSAAASMTSMKAQSVSEELVKAGAETAYAKMPLSFEVNRGQTDKRVKFLARGKGYTLFLTPSEAVLSLQTAATSKTDVVRMQLKGSNSKSLIEGLDILPTRSNYMIGADQKKWQTNIQHYSKVQYKQVYPGIDIVYYGNQGQLEYDFVVAPGADPGLIRMDFKGANRLELDKKGNLVLKLSEGQLSVNAPAIYQKNGETKLPVEGRFVLASSKLVSFEVGTYDKSKELIIDPIVYSTYLGVTVEDRATAIAVENDGTVYLTGKTATVADVFPGTAGHFQAANAGGAFDAFVIKISAAGAIEWATYLGGVASDISNSIAVDAAHKVYICGSTTGAFPITVGAYQVVNNGGTDGFVTAIAADGNSLVYSTMLGGAGVDFCNALVSDSAGVVYVTGGTASNNILLPATAGAYQTQNGGGAGGVANAFVAKFNAAGTRQYFSYIGGATAGTTQGNAITIDATGNIYITGSTVAGWPTFPSGVLPLPRAFKLTIGGAQDTFVAKIAPLGNGSLDLLYSSYLGGSGLSKGTGIRLDSSGNVYVAGNNDSTDFPDAATDGITVGFPKVGQTTIAGGPFDCFVMKMAFLNTGHSDGIYCTFLGGNNDDDLAALIVDSFGDAYVTGRTMSPDFLTVAPTSILTPIDSTFGATAKVFLAAVSADGSTRELKSYLGGVTDQGGAGIALDGAHNIYIGGWTSSTDFPTAGPMGAGAGALYPALTGAASFDAFVLKISAPYPNPLPTITSVSPAGGPPAGGTTVVIEGTGFTDVTGATGVTFGNVNATSYTVNSSTQITAVAPAHAAGVVDIVVRNPAGASVAVPADIYTYFLPGIAPTVTSLEPTGGVPAGGTTVVINGTGFTGIVASNGVKFGALNATSYVVNSDIKITAVAPAHIAGPVDVVVTNIYGSSAIVPGDVYTYFLAGSVPPTITGLNPTLGSTLGGTTVVITGTGFNGVTSVKFGDLNAESYVVNSDVKITAKTKAHAVGIVDVVVTALTGATAIVPADKYTYFTAATARFSPYVFPSPTTGKTAGIAYWMTGPGSVNIRIYNEVGDLMQTLDETKATGTQGSTINTGDLARGVYFCLLKMAYDDVNTSSENYKLKFAVTH